MAKQIKREVTKRQTAPLKKSFWERHFNLLAMGLLVVVTVMIYYPSMNNQLTNWDDNLYVTENPAIKTLHGDSIGYTLQHTFTSFKNGNYHPLTMLSYCVEYSLFQLDPKPYHVTNLIFNILNSLLVLLFVLLLTKQRTTAFITAMLFAIHPMHVESVAWVSERKDVLYTFFSLLSLCFYLLYTSTHKRKVFYYILALFAFVLALLSKAMSVVVPVIFILADYFSGRKFTVKSLLEKVPFLALSLLFGIISIPAQQSFNAVGDLTNYNFLLRFLFVTYELVIYLWKAVLPINLTAFYSYPFKPYPLIVYASPGLIAVLVLLIFLSKRYGRDIIFGFGFFIVSLVMVLQLLPVGGAIVAERYTYLAYIGLFFIAGRGVDLALSKLLPRQKVVAMMLVVSLTGIFGLYAYLARQRTKVWESSITLWTDVLLKNSLEPRGYINLGHVYYQNNQYHEALAVYDQYVKIDDNKPNKYVDRGLCHLNLKNYDLALSDFSKAIVLKPGYADAFYNRGCVYNDIEKFPEAVSDYTKALAFDSTYLKALYNRAGAYYKLGKFDLALADALKAKQKGHPVETEFIDILKQNAGKK